MIQLQETCPFHPGLHRLSVIITDLTESEALIRQMAQDAQRAYPEDFAGKSPCVYYKMPYIPPYETFQELRRLILRVRENTGLRAHFRGVVAIEVTEWLGHEEEEYFTVLLKYLYDHRDLWQAALVLHPGTTTQTQQFIASCARYITPKLIDASLFSCPDRLREVICRENGRQGRIITRDAAQRLAEGLGKSEFKHVQSLTFIRRTAAEVGNSSHGGIITLDVVEEYLTDPHSLLAMIAGKTLSDERSKVNAAEPLQL